MRRISADLIHDITIEHSGAPEVTNDSAHSCTKGMFWRDVSAIPPDLYACTVDTPGAAVWENLTSATPASGGAFGEATTFPLWAVETLKSYLRPNEYIEGVQLTLDGDYQTSLTGTHDVNGFVYGLDTPTDYQVSVYASSDIEYLIGTQALSANGAWTVAACNFGANTSVKLVRLELVSDDTPVSEVVGTNNHLVRSYNIPTDDVNYARLSKRCFIYDQATSLIAMINQGETATVEAMMRGLLLCQKPGVPAPASRNGQYGFGYYCLGWDPATDAISPVDPYYRTGAEMWVAYAMLHFLQKVPTSTLCTDVQAAVINLLDAHIYNTLNTTPGDYRENAFQGGFGKYSVDYLTFDPDFVIDWCATEHNVDALFAYRRAADLGLVTATGTPYSTVAANLGAKLIALADGTNKGFWYAAGSRAVQGIDTSSTFDTAHALDCGSWYSLVARYLGDIQKANEALVSTEPYRVTDALYGGAHAYTPYLAAFGYPDATPAAWLEGTAGVILARFAAGQDQLYVEEFAQALRFKNTQGFPYTTIEIPAYELQPWNSVTSLAWMMIADKPGGFWYVGEVTTAGSAMSAFGAALVAEPNSGSALTGTLGGGTAGAAVFTSATRVGAQGAIGQLRAYRNADLTRVSTTPSDDPQVKVTLESGKTYRIRVNCTFHQPSNDESFQWTYSTPTIDFGTKQDIYYDADSGATRLRHEELVAAPFATIDAVATAVGKGFLQSEVIIHTTGAGDFALKWSNQSTSIGATGPTLMAGASIEAIEIG